MQVPPFLQGLLSQSLISEKERKGKKSRSIKDQESQALSCRPPPEETDAIGGSKILSSIRTASPMHQAGLS